MRYRKESREIHLSVEGINCEKGYFEHLAKLINESGENIYNVRFDIKPNIGPVSMAKRCTHIKIDTYGKNQKIPFMHICDIEDYDDKSLRGRFYKTIDEMEMVKNSYKIPYELGYSNYTFELWMLLHVRDMSERLANRKDYLRYVNDSFKKKYKSLDEFKRESEFKAILDEHITLNSVRQACRRAQVLRDNQKSSKLEKYRFFEFHHDNPDTTVHEVIGNIFTMCGMKL